MESDELFSLPPSVWERFSPLQTVACQKCPRCRKYTDPDERAIYVPALWLAWHPACFLSGEGRS